MRNYHHERLTLFLAEGVLYAEPFQGRSNGVLALLSIGLARVPCIEDPQVVWHDWVAAAPFLHRTRRVFHDLCDPFLNVAVLPYRYAVASHGDGFRITATLHKSAWQDTGIPKILTTEIRGRHAVFAIDGETCGGRIIHVRMTGYQTRGGKPVTHRRSQPERSVDGQQQTAATGISCASHCSGASMTADAHAWPMNPRFHAASSHSHRRS